jgi:hypothetical protein
MILGEKLENPYSVENMKAAYEKLQADNVLKSGLQIEATHLYVRFRPKNGKEQYLITGDTTLHVYDYPLDVKIKKGGTHYHDPEIPKNEITWQYTVVPVDYEFPKVQYQKLADLYLPEVGKDLVQIKSAQIDYLDWKKLENESLKMTGNLSEEEQNGNKLKSTTWRPAGSIKVFDDIINSYSTTIKVFSHYEYFYCDTGDPVGGDDPTADNPEGGEGGSGVVPDGENICASPVYHYETNSVYSHYIPLEGVEVRARRWFTTHTGIIDANGNFTCDGTFDKDAEYSIKWERNDFDIRDGSYGQAYFNGPSMTGDWNLVIQDTEASPKSFLFAHIFRGAYTYYYKHNQWGIKAPTKRGFLQERLHICGIDGSGRSTYNNYFNIFQNPDIMVYRNDNNSQEIFGTSVHELAHASHWEIGYSYGQYVVDWIFSSVTLPESWATGVEAVVTNDVYNTTNYETKQTSRYTIAYMTTGDYKGYTSLVWDLIDDHNQFGTNTLYPDDQVFGYSISQLEDALELDPDNWWGWRNNIRDSYNNPTEIHLDKLFHALQ